MNTGDVIFQLFTFAFLLGLIYIIIAFFKRNSRITILEKKMDRILEMLVKKGDNHDR